MNSESDLIQEIRQRASDISARYGDNLREYAKHLKEVEKKHADRLVNQIRVVRGARREPRGGHP